jgi:uncharacterized protein (TIGR00369 family)
MEPDAALTQQAHDVMPFAALLGVEMLSGRAEEVRARMAWRPDLCTIAGGLHGGALMALADSVGATLAFLNLPEGAVGTTTVSSTTNFIRGLNGGGHAHAAAQVLHKGRTTIVVVTDITDDDGRLLGRVTQTQAVLQG